MNLSARPDSLAELFDQIEVSVMVIDRETGIIRSANRRCRADTRKSHDEIEGRHYRQFFWPEFVPLYEQLQNECDDNLEHTAIHYWAEMLVWEHVSARAVLWESVPCILLSITIISHIAKIDYLLDHMAYFDNLLKLPNGEKLEMDIGDLACTGDVAVLYFEIERLDEINHLYGWANGNSILMQIRDWLQASESRRARLYRFSDGFAIFGREVTMEDSKARAAQILERFAKPWRISVGGNDISLYCSVKVCVMHGKYVKNEMRSILLRTARDNGISKEGYKIFDERMDRMAKRAMTLRDDMLNCVNNGMRGFEVHYQPIVDTDSGRWLALEALCRWTAPGGERIAPPEFIPIAEQLDLIGKIDAWVWNTAMEQCVSLSLTDRSFFLDVNFSPTKRIDDFLVDRVMTMLRNTNFPPGQLDLEITESAKMSFDAENLDGLKRLKDAGINLSLDDFGTGYSSIANLINIPANALKTDRLFLDNIENDPHRQYLLRMIVDLAHFHNMRIVAEGVETATQLDILRKFGADFAQGYLFARPMPFAQLKANVFRFG